ncbi:calcium-binding protein [Methylobacterium sp. Leaf118]|uniref:calcium-binding protein n=1 Tax=Methylobacterium sp. Leaf118 TaxID=2876562 RepID=UPI001E5CDE05|nr:calcium-binding protein [Methylobacterium sp. Leaf118]
MAVINGNDEDNKYFYGIGLPGPNGNDPLIGTFAIDTIHGLGGDDDILGLDSFDRLYGDGGNDYIEGGRGGDIIDGGTGDDYIRGGADPDEIHGGAGNDTIFFGRSARQFGSHGGVGDDQGSDVGVIVTLASRNSASGGTGQLGDAEGDTYDSIANVSGTDGNDIIRGTNGYIGFLGTPGQPGRIVTLDGDNELRGNGGNDQLSGLGGNDTLRGGNDQDTLTGGNGDDKLYGENGDDRLIGGAGADRLSGGNGIDTVSYQASAAGIYISLAGDMTGTGGDAQGDTFIAQSGSEFSPVDYIENAEGSEYTDVIIGNTYANTIRGGGAGDYLYGRDGNDTIYGDGTGFSGGNDIIWGGRGADRLIGGFGTNTASYSDSASGVTVNLATNVAFGGDAQGDTFSEIQNVTGSEFSDTLTGAATLPLFGTSYVGSGLNGMGGNDTLNGSAEADFLNGGAGADRMVGGAGDDGYSVDNLGDVVIEASGQGTDRVTASISYALTANIENLDLFYEAGSINGTGNNLANVITGNGGQNVLNGLGGVDTMKGLYGNDTYIVDNAGDQVIEGKSGGQDAVAAGVSYTLTAGQEIEALRVLQSVGDGAINLTGNSYSQALVGNNGANVLNGGWGNDVLTGQGGADTFVFANGLYTDNVDRITDFSSVDTIRLSDDIFTALAPGPLAASAFKNITTGTVDASDRMLYKQSTGELFYDSDGSGSAVKVKVAVFDNKAALTADDFFVV